MAADSQEVKGLVFDTARIYFLEHYGKAQWDALMYMLPRQTVDVFEHPQLTEWYAESEMRRFIHLVFEDLCKEDEDKFVALVHKVADTAIRRFLRMIPDLESGHFVLRNIPTFFRRIRRGTATVRVETASDNRILIHYENYRYCRDRLYRLMAMACCQAAVHAATGKYPRGAPVSWDRASMSIEFVIED